MTRKRLPVRRLDAAALDGFYAELRRRRCSQSRFDRQPLKTPPHAAAGTQRGLAVAEAR